MVEGRWYQYQPSILLSFCLSIFVQSEWRPNLQPKPNQINTYNRVQYIYDGEKSEREKLRATIIFESHDKSHTISDYKQTNKQINNICKLFAYIVYTYKKWNLYIECEVYMHMANNGAAVVTEAAAAAHI